MAERDERQFRTLGDLLALSSEAFRPPERMTVAEAAEKYRWVHNPPSYVGPWKNRTTPYLVEPMNELSSLDYRGWVFVSASQSGKTDLALNWLTYNAICDPADMMIVEITQPRSSDFSLLRVDRLNTHTQAMKERMLNKVGSDTVRRKRYTSGMVLLLSWPSKNELSGRPMPRLFLTDYDRMPADVDGEGSAYILAQGRITTYGRHGMVAAESSPSFPVLDPAWTPETPHQAPPCEGILSLYNQGDRRRWYWQCVNCREAFEPAFSLLEWEDLGDPLKCAKSAYMKCPFCSQKYRHDDSDVPGKFSMNLNGRWVKDGQMLLKDGSIVGDPVESDTASFWLQGVAAAFKDWETIVFKYLNARQEYLRTGSEASLKATVNTDQSQPYTPKILESDRLPEQLKARAYGLPHREVPDGVRFLVAAIDVQQSRFVVQVMGVGVNADLWVVDRFNVRYSRRADPARPDQFYPVRPFTYREDWRLLMTQVILKTYPLADGTGRHMAIKTTVCDSGGMDRTTANAYDFWRWLKAGPQPQDKDADEWPEWTGGLHGRFCLFRGVDTRVGYRIKLQYPDSGRQNRFAGARGDVPVLYTNVTPIKNHLDAILDRLDAGTGRINFPDWLDLDFYKELTVEQKNLKGVWENPRNFRNESWDCFVMALAVMLERRHVGIETVRWTKPPGWARPWDDNDLVFNPKGGDDPRKPKKRRAGALAELARKVG